MRSSDRTPRVNLRIGSSGAEPPNAWTEVGLRQETRPALLPTNRRRTGWRASPSAVNKPARQTSPRTTPWTNHWSRLPPPLEWLSPLELGRYHRSDSTHSFKIQKPKKHPKRKEKKTRCQKKKMFMHRASPTWTCIAPAFICSAAQEVTSKMRWNLRRSASYAEAGSTS